jgi:septal ring factor EnvC (AmiA/AmiB activator)
MADSKKVKEPVEVEEGVGELALAIRGAEARLKELNARRNQLRQQADALDTQVNETRSEIQRLEHQLLIAVRGRE